MFLLCVYCVLRMESFWSASGFKRIRIDESSSLQENCQSSPNDVDEGN